MSTMAVRDVFRTLGFVEGWGAMTDEQPGYIADFGPIQIRTNEVQGHGLKRVMKLTGLARNARTLKLIDFDLPLHVASHEQGVALIGHAVGCDYNSPIAREWLDEVRTWARHLAWVSSIPKPDQGGVQS